jgi:hypothetical protein
MDAKVGERSRSESDCSGFGEGAMEGDEERRTGVMKGGRGGAREAESSAEDSYKWETSSLEVDAWVRSSAFVCWRSLDILGRERRQARREKSW